ncbi:MAG: ATP-binding protein [Candidatus Methanomethylophilaceae archaeon]
MSVYFQDNEVMAGWEEIINRDDYHLKIVEIQDNYPKKKSLFVPYADIDLYNPDLAMFILAHPDNSVKLGEKVLRGVLPASWDPADTINLRITDLPRDAHVEVRDLRAEHLGKLVAVEGLVRKATVPKPRLVNALFRCTKCDAEIWIKQTGMIQREPLMCTNDGCNKSVLKFVLDEVNSKFINTQKIEIQENPEGLRGGAQPERLAGYIDDDVAGAITPGNRVTLNGTIRSVQKTDRDKSTVYDIFMDVMSVVFEQHEFSEIEITENDEIRIKEMSEDPELMQNIVKSISPTIYGLEKEKEAVALQLFGGSHKMMDDKTSIRGDIHILLIGDPGVAKSQLLRYMSNLAPRGIYASGKSASAAGLCVHGDTVLPLATGKEKIIDFINARMDSPEEYRQGIWRQDVSGDKILAMSDLGSLRYLPITCIWKIRTPERLIRLSTGDESVILTPETKVQAMQNARFDWIEAKDLKVGDRVSLFHDNIRFLPLTVVQTVTEDLPEFVYDLTVEPAHSFIGSGFVIHNTAAAVKDDFGDGRWTLEAGALVLADKGLACIDELDKMTPQDRSSLHEAMESQRISVAKAGITATLQCRCSLLAAANPKHGRFIPEEKPVGQIDLPPALMSRFDLIFVIQDKPDAKLDKEITKHILRAHQRGQVRSLRETDIEGVNKEKILAETDDIAPVYDEELLRKYVAYAKQNYHPVMTDTAKTMIENDYLNIRKTGEGGNTVPITARQLEAYVRLSEASAKARLSNFVEEQDAARAIDMVNYYLNKIAMDKSTGKFDVDRIGSDFTGKERSVIARVLDIISDFDSTGGITFEELRERIDSKSMNNYALEKELERLSQLGDIYVAGDHYKLV